MAVEWCHAPHDPTPRMSAPDGDERATAQTRPELAGARRRPVMTAAKRLSAVGSGLSAEPSLGGCWVLRGHDLGPALDHPRGAMAPGPTQRVLLDGRTLQSSCESDPRAGYDGYKRKHGSATNMASDTSGHLLAAHITPANEQERAQVQVLSEAVQQPRAVKSSGSGLHGREDQAGGAGQRHRAAGGQAARSQEGLHPAGPALDGGAQLGLAGTVSPVGSGLRAIAYSFEQPSFPGLRSTHAAGSRTDIGCVHKLIKRLKK